MGNLAPGNVRLCKYHRNAIATRIMNYKFQSSSNVLKSLETEHRNLAQAVYESVYSKSDREKMAAIPVGWLFEEDDIRAQFGGTVGQLTYNGSLYGLKGYNYDILKKMGYEKPDELTRRVPYANHFGVKITFDHDHPITSRFNALTNRFDTLIEESRNAQRVLEATLKNASTSNALIKAWPEIEPFVKQVVGTRTPVSSVSLVVPVAELNTTFGLPVPA